MNAQSGKETVMENDNEFKKVSVLLQDNETDYEMNF